MNSDFTDITIILDRSGSMQSIKADTIGGFNNFLAEQKKLPGRANLTLIKFDHEYDVAYAGVSIAGAMPLTDSTFEPRGSTALLDAIGRTIDDAGARLRALPEKDRPGKVIMVIITDGMENSSRKFSRTHVSEKIAHQRAQYNWEFLFLGANMDAVQVAKDYSISPDFAMTYAANQVGTASAYFSAGTSLRSFRAGNSAAFTAEDRDAQTQAGA